MFDHHSLFSFLLFYCLEYKAAGFHRSYNIFFLIEHRLVAPFPPILKQKNISIQVQDRYYEKHHKQIRNIFWFYAGIFHGLGLSTVERKFHLHPVFQTCKNYWISTKCIVNIASSMFFNLFHKRQWLKMTVEFFNMVRKKLTVLWISFQPTYFKSKLQRKSIMQFSKYDPPGYFAFWDLFQIPYTSILCLR